MTPVPPSGTASLISQSNSGAKPGTTVELGSFSYTAGAGGTEQVLSSVSVSVSRPKIFSSLTLTALVDGDTVGSSTVTSPAIVGTTVFPFVPSLDVTPGETLTFDLSGVISGGKSAALLEHHAQVRLAGMITGGSKPNDFEGTGNLMFALSLFGFVIAPLTSTRQRRRVSMLAAAMIVLATVMAGCGGSSNNAPSVTASQQEVTGVDVTQDGNQVAVSGLPIDLGKIRKQ